MKSLIVLLALRTGGHAWHAPSPTGEAFWCSSKPRAQLSLQLQVDPPDPSRTGAATGEEVEKTDGIPNYMLRTSGTVSRVAEGSQSSATVASNGVFYEQNRLVCILTSDVIDMVQQQGGAAESVDYLGENILVKDMLFDDFKADDMFELASPDRTDDSADTVTLQVVETRPPSEVELGQLGDDQDKRNSISSLVSLAAGFSGWKARILNPGHVRAGFIITKREA
jgi:hypothetical protein